MKPFHENQWALILGGSSGFGLAAAKKLSALGMSVCIVHRDRRGAMPRIEEDFEQIRKQGRLLSFNEDALQDENQDTIIQGLKEAMGTEGSVRVLLHSIALGNLKLLAPLPAKTKSQNAIQALAAQLKLPKDRVEGAIAEIFQDNPELFSLIEPQYAENLIEQEDMAQTIYSMGSSLLSWTQKLFQQKLFAADARVLGLTSEGNQIAWRGYAAVSAAKVVLESIARSIATEFAAYGIRCNIIQAGVTDTPALRAIPGQARMKAFAELRNPFKRLTRPEDIADVISLLARDEAGWINGTIICADGGEHITSF